IDQPRREPAMHARPAHRNFRKSSVFDQLSRFCTGKQGAFRFPSEKNRGKQVHFGAPALAIHELHLDCCKGCIKAAHRYSAAPCCERRWRPPGFIIIIPTGRRSKTWPSSSTESDSL